LTAFIATMAMKAVFFARVIVVDLEEDLELLFLVVGVKP
jgi:hypothetical protein